MHLLQKMGRIVDSFKRLDWTKLFFQTTLYSGKEGEPLYLQEKDSVKKKD